MEYPKNTTIDMEHLDEEFNNFMIKVNEVSSIVHKLTSDNRELQKIGDREAERYLRNDTEEILENIDEDDVVLTIKNSKTVINRRALLENDNKDPNQMSQEAFMAEISKDADQRYKDKLIRREKMETFKKQANLAFRRGQYEKALSLYNKAIEQIKDSLVLYNNRALTYIKLKLFDKAKDDVTNWALRLDENCLKSWLLLAKIHFQSGDNFEFEKAVKEAKCRNPNRTNFIQGYIEEMKGLY